MAVYNELQVGRYVRFLQKFLGIKGRQPAPLIFSGEIGALWALFHGVENRNLEGWNRFGTSLNQAASVGNVNAVRIRNPSGSGVVLVIEQFIVESGAANTMFISQGATGVDLGSIQSLTGARFDPRGNPQPSAIISFTQAAVIADLANRLGLVQPAATTSAPVIQDENQELTILPGDAIQLATTVVNTGSAVSWWWRERSLEESERA